MCKFLSSRRNKLKQVNFNKRILVYRTKVVLCNTCILHRGYLHPVNLYIYIYICIITYISQNVKLSLFDDILHTKILHCVHHG